MTWNDVATLAESGGGHAPAAFFRSNYFSGVMPGLDPPGIVAGIYVFLAAPPYPASRMGEGREAEDVDGSDKPSHDSE
jgi:hypothetical protein